MGDKAGKVSKGLSKAEINMIESKVWYRGKTVSDTCPICMENFKTGEKYKKLSACNHEFHSNCIDTWLLEEKVCPIDRKAV